VGKRDKSLIALTHCLSLLLLSILQGTIKLKTSALCVKFLKRVRCVSLEDFLHAKNSRIFLPSDLRGFFDEYSRTLSHSDSNFLIFLINQTRNHFDKKLKVNLLK
jgi:hypothetical protein